MAFIDLISSMFMQGLGEHLMLHKTERNVYLGYILYEKGMFVIKDQELLPGVKPALLYPCWQNGYLGAVCSSKAHEWESLTFYGLEQCELEVDLSSTRHGALIAAENQYGDKLIDFVGSVYRGFQLLLDYHYLPVVLLKHVRTKAGEDGLAVSDLRMVPMEISIIQTINDIVRKSVEKRLTFGVADLQLNPDEFKELFGNYLTDK